MRSRSDSRGHRLSALDATFLRLESAHAHMHVGWSATLAVPPNTERPTLETLRDRVGSRLDDVGWFRWKLAPGALGLTEPRWVSADDFQLASHVLALSSPEDEVSYETFVKLRGEQLSEPLDRRRPMWQIFLVPRLSDGRVGIFGKIHHSLVDGMAALQVVRLLVDEVPREVADRDGVPSSGLVARPAGRAGRGRFRRIAHAVRDDLLPRAPASMLNVPIGPRRTLATYHASRAELKAARANGGTLNDVGLTVVAGALRALADERGVVPSEPLRAMIPVSMRRIGETGPGNKISMIHIDLPVDRATPLDRLESVRSQTLEFKDGRRAKNMEELYAAGRLLPTPLRAPVAKAMGSPRVFNLTISQAPGPRGTLHMLGCEAEDIYSVIPIADRHALAIGMTRYRQELFIGCYADPDALPEIAQLPALLKREMEALARPPATAAGATTSPAAAG